MVKNCPCIAISLLSSIHDTTTFGGTKLLILFQKRKTIIIKLFHFNLKKKRKYHSLTGTNFHTRVVAHFSRVYRVLPTHLTRFVGGKVTEWYVGQYEATQYHTVHRRFNVISCPCKPASRGSLENRAFTDRRCIASREHARANVRDRRFPRRVAPFLYKKKEKQFRRTKSLGRCLRGWIIEPCASFLRLARVHLRANPRAKNTHYCRK